MASLGKTFRLQINSITRSFRTIAHGSLLVIAPDLAREWDASRNGMALSVTTRVAADSRVWWRCAASSEHVWQASYAIRLSFGHMCPFCSKEKFAPSETFLMKHPDLAQELHPTLNDNIDVKSLGPHSTLRLMWQCRSGHPDHVWRVSVSARVRGGGKCPYCAGKLAVPSESVQALYPNVAAEFHPSKNAPLTPDMVLPSSERVIWWKCAKFGHETRGQIRTRTEKQKSCRLCRGLSTTREDNLATQNPSRAAYFHPTKNEPFTPHNICASSLEKVWFRCTKGPDHEWRATVADPVHVRRRAREKDERTRATNQCPFCAGRRRSVTNTLAGVVPEIGKLLHPFELDPSEIPANSSEMIWWRCQKTPEHQYRYSPKYRVKLPVDFCPICNPKPRMAVRPRPGRSLAEVFPTLAAMWHPTRNGDLTPADIHPHTLRVVWWQLGSAEFREVVTNMAARHKKQGISRDVASNNQETRKD
eukprot:955862_1